MIDDLFNPNPEGTDRLHAGFYLLKMRRSSRIDVPVRVWFGPPEDPDYRQYQDANAPSGMSYTPIALRPTLERSPRWQVEINGILFGDPDNPPCIAGRPVETLDGIWPQCMAEPIDQDEYEYRVARSDWAEQWDGDDPYSGTGARVDPMTARLPFQ